MREQITVGLGQWHATPGDGAANLRDALVMIGELASRGSELVVLPELWASGYDASRLDGIVTATAEPLAGPRGEALAQAARQHGVWLLAGSVPELAGNRIHNTSVLYGPDGVIAGVHRKAHLYAPTGEDEIFAAGDEVTVIDTPDFGKVGIATCFDADHPGYARAMRDRGARLVLMPTAYELGAEHWWDVLHPANALANGQWWVMVNQSGGDGQGAMFGRSRILAPDGRTIHEAPRHDAGIASQLTTCTIDFLAGLRTADAENAALWEGARPDIY